MQIKLVDLQELYLNLPKLLGVPQIFKHEPCARHCGTCDYCYAAKKELWEVMSRPNVHTWALIDKEIEGFIFLILFSDHGKKVIEMHGAIWTGKLWKFTAAIEMILKVYQGYMIRVPVPDYAPTMERYLKKKLGFTGMRVLRRAVDWHGSLHNVMVMERHNGSTSNRARDQRTRADLRRA